MPDVDNGTCAGKVRFTGEYVDWDSGDANFCGIFGAQFQAQGGAMSMTAPNGRFDLCVPDGPTALVDITAPSAQSQCTTPPGSYELAGIAVANKAVIDAAGAWSGRGFVMGRVTVDTAKAQVFVHVDRAARTVSVAAAHLKSEARVSGTWAEGDTGQDVFFYDVDPSGGTTTLSANGALGAGEIPLAAGKVTYVSIIAQ